MSLCREQSRGVCPTMLLKHVHLKTRIQNWDLWNSVGSTRDSLIWRVRVTVSLTTTRPRLRFP